jgi:pimeloyl-ACP methyl ester carboxylesterase
VGLATETISTIVLLGHSEGTIVAPRISVERLQVRGLVLLCPTITDFETVLIRQAEQIDHELKHLPGLQGKLLRLYTKISGNPLPRQRDLIARIRASTTPTVRIVLRTFEAAWLRELLQLELALLLAAVGCPMLVVAGAKDVQCDPKTRAGSPRSTRGRSPRDRRPHSHPSPRPRPAALFGYQKLLTQPVDTELLDLIADWVERLQASSRARGSRDEVS